MIEAVGVLGGGRMGAGIAHVFACAGASVTIMEDGPDACRQAAERVRTGLERAQERNALPRPLEELVASITFVTDEAEMDSATGLIIEALPEIDSLKAAVLGRVEAVVGERCVLATNTSSLSIDRLARDLRRPDRFLGMHFFNPVPASDLVELVTGSSTAAEVLDAAVGWVAELGKQEIVVRDSPGFATSRLGVTLGLEAIRMLQDGVADAAGIDRAMELGYRHPMGPLKLTDLVGLDVRLHIAEHLESTLGARFSPPELLRQKVAAGELGRKTGLGFYEWKA